VLLVYFSVFLAAILEDVAKHFHTVNNICIGVYQKSSELVWNFFTFNSTCFV